MLGCLPLLHLTCETMPNSFAEGEQAMINKKVLAFIIVLALAVGAFNIAGFAVASGDVKATEQSAS